MKTKFSQLGVASENGKNRTLSRLQWAMPELARLGATPVLLDRLSVKRSLVGQRRRLSGNRLFNGLSDIKIDGRNNGQEGR